MFAKPLRTALGSLIIQKQYKYSDRELVEQQQYMYDNEVHSVKDRIVSISQPYIRPIHLMPTMNVMSSSMQLKDIANSIYMGQEEDITGGCLNFYSPMSMDPPGTVPNWAYNMTEVTIDGVDPWEFTFLK